MGKDDNFKLESSNVFVDRILALAIDNRASDIHLEPDRDSFNVRFRIDGILREIERVGKYAQEGIISRIKVLSQIDITEHHIPQDGHFEFRYKEIIYNVRISTLPTTFGETMVFRILNRKDMMIGMENLGLEVDQLELVNNLIASPSGMLLITGPTASGKTTLLYSMLQELNKPEKNIITIEDPIEFQMENVRQVQVNEAMGLNFSKAMRSVVRQDPDVIMLGEIRDADTAQMAIQASLIGILVFSTFHTFDVPALVTRLFEMGISSSTVAQSIAGVISARLVRKVCGTCKESYQPNDEERKIIGDVATQGHFLRGRGCEICKNTGYLGRIGIFEIDRFDDEIKAAIIERKPASYISEILSRKKTKSLRQAGMDKVLQGETTIDEITRVLGIFTVKQQS